MDVDVKHLATLRADIANYSDDPLERLHYAIGAFNVRVDLGDALVGASADDKKLAMVVTRILWAVARGDEETESSA